MTGVVTDDGVNVALNRFAKSTPDYTAPAYLVASYDNTTPVITDSSLVEPLGKSLTTIDDCETADWTQGGVGSNETVNSTSGEYKEGAGCLNLPTSGSGTANWDKTISNTDMSGNYLFIWFYITVADVDLTDATDAVRITLGTSGYTNVNYYDVDRADLTDGWNLLVFEVDSPSSTGGSGATETTINRLRISVKVDSAQVTNDMRMDYWGYDSDIYVSLVSGYPTINESTKEITHRFLITSTQMNDLQMNKAYIVNNDATKKICMIDDHDSIDKTNKQQVTYEMVTGGSDGS